MESPELHESTSHATGEDAAIVKQPIVTKHLIGIALGIVLAIIVYFLMPDVLPEAVAAASPEDAPFSAQAMAVTAAVAVLMGTWWVTEAIPLPATALVPLVVFPLTGTAPFAKVAGPYANGTIFLFMGGFFLALAIQRWNLHRRIALRIVLAVGTRPRQLVLGLMIATGFMTMWVSNTATAVMMLPIALSVLSLVYEGAGAEQMLKSNFGKSMVLGVAYAASITSVATLIGTPPNALLRAYLTESHPEISLNFGQWMLFATPLAWTFLFFGWWLLSFRMFPPEFEEIAGGRELIRHELEKMGPMSRGEKLVGIVFVLGALAWIFLPSFFEVFSDELVAMLIALALFLIPVRPLQGVQLLDWKTAKNIPWDVLILFGGGLSLSSMFTATGFSLWIGENTKGIGSLHPILIIFIVTVLIVILTEFTSNTATAAAFLPIMGGVAVGIGVHPLLLLIPVALASTYGFMMPAGTPPNAIAYSSGYVKIADMIKGGFWLNVVGAFMITVFVYLLAPLVFGFTI